MFQRKHMQDMVRVGNKLPHYDMVSTIGIVRDVPDYLTDLIGSLEHFANGVKPMVLLCSDEHKFDDVLRMFETLHQGDLGEKPFIIPYFNPVSPLVMNEGTVDKMKIAIERGLPGDHLQLQFIRRDYTDHAGWDGRCFAGGIACRFGDWTTI